ncbi:MAG: DUF4349 domain-containing protein [Ruminococcus sp.]|nr:DUF4349 domain-containing protein [Ruminococcus sp.]
MKNKCTQKILVFVLLTLILSSLLCACGSDIDSVVDNGYTSAEKGSGYLTEDYISDSASDSSGSSSESTSIKDTRKIIETIYYRVQTKNFDEFVSTLETQALSVGGYIEQSDVSGNAYDDISSRYATYTFRIPSDKVDDFTNTVSEKSTVTSKTINTEDVTLEYVDVQSRIKALKVEKESLEELLSSATSTTEIIEIRDMLTDVIYEIERYESQLRTFDNLVDYTSITVEIDEVEHPVVVHEQTTWQRIGTNLADNFRSLWDFLVELFVIIVSSLPYLLFIAIIVVAIIVIIKRLARKSKNKKKNNTSLPVAYYTPYNTAGESQKTTQPVDDKE